MQNYRTEKMIVLLLLLFSGISIAQLPKENIAIIYEKAGSYKIEPYTEKITTALQSDIDFIKSYNFKYSNDAEWRQLTSMDATFIKENFENYESCKKYVFKFSFSKYGNANRLKVEVWDVRTPLPISWKIVYDQDIDEGTGNINIHVKHIIEYMKLILLKNKYCTQLSVAIGGQDACNISNDILTEIHSIRKNHFKYKYYLIRNASIADINIKFDTHSNTIHCKTTSNAQPIYSPKIDCSNPSTDHLNNILNNLVTNIKTRY